MWYARQVCVSSEREGVLEQKKSESETILWKRMLRKVSTWGGLTIAWLHSKKNKPNNNWYNHLIFKSCFQFQTTFSVRIEYDPSDPTDHTD